MATIHCSFAHRQIGTGQSDVFFSHIGSFENISHIGSFPQIGVKIPKIFELSPPRRVSIVSHLEFTFGMHPIFFRTTTLSKVESLQLCHHDFWCKVWCGERNFSPPSDSWRKSPMSKSQNHEGFTGFYGGGSS